MKNSLVDRARLRKLLAKGVAVAREIVPPSMQERMPVAMRRFAERVMRAGKTDVQRLEDKLWGGFSHSALDDLQAVADADAATAKDRFEALQILAAWDAADKNFSRALDRVERAREIAPDRAGGKGPLMFEAQLYCQLGQGAKVRDLLGRQAKAGAFDATHEMLLANSFNPGCVAHENEGDIGRALAHINAIYRKFGVCDIGLIDADGPLSMDNVEGVPCPDIIDADKTIGIIVPAYNAADTIETALRSIAQQSWKAIRVLIVDDCSTDETCAVAEAFCAKDERFSLYRKTENSGTYASRNLALDILDTPFITVHDADDWSHPQKLEKQMEALVASGDDYNYTMLVRATPEMVFMSEARPSRRLLVPNHWAGLFRTQLVRDAGGWDHARISADTELFWRVEALNGNRRQATRHRRLMVGCPLAIGRVLPSSLTQTGPTHTLTMYHGVRREYREAAEFWHHNQMDRAILKRPFFAAPGLIRPGTPDNPMHDLFAIADFTADGFAARSALDMVVHAARTGRSVAILCYRHYATDVTKPLPDAVRWLASQNDIRIVAPGEKVRTRLALVAEAELLQHRLDRFPDTEADCALIVADRMAGDANHAFDREKILANGRAALGAEARWAPASALGARRMDKDARFAAPLGAVFRPLLTAPEGGAQAERGVLRVGVLDEGERLERTESGTALLRDVTVYGMGEGDGRGEAMGGPRSTLADLFAEIDIFIYFPQSEFSDLLGYPAALAMAHGVPVITAPEFEINFGSAALYGEPETAWALARKLRDDPALHRAMRAAARQTADRLWGAHAFGAQLDDVIARSQAQPSAMQ